MARAALFPLLHFALPSACFVCLAPLGRLQHLGACTSCWRSLARTRPPSCPTCGLPRAEGTDLLGPARGRCARCVVDPPPVDVVRGAVIYDAVARAFLLRAKMGRRRELFAPLSAQLARTIEVAGLADGCTMLAAVPSHPWTTLRRGFAPGPELARHLARRLGLRRASRLLRRRWATPLASKRLGARHRRRVAASGFVAVGGVPGERILLVDDVMTSGSTLHACARALRAAGAAEVRAAVWARTLPGAPRRAAPAVVCPQGFDYSWPLDGRSG